MSARKRHTAALDFMRLFVAYERGLSSSWPWHKGGLQTLERLIKRGWIEQTRTSAHPRMGSWYLNTGTRHNGLRSTAKGRRAVYVADRYTSPHLRAHDWDQVWRGRHMRSQLKMMERDSRDRERVSRRISDLHGTRP